MPWPSGSPGLLWVQQIVSDWKGTPPPLPKSRISQIARSIQAGFSCLGHECLTRRQILRHFFHRYQFAFLLCYWLLCLGLLVSLVIYIGKPRFVNWAHTRRVRHRVRAWPLLEPAPENLESRMYT